MKIDNFKESIQKLNYILEENNPIIFSSSWIFSKSQPLYLYFSSNFRTENGDIDWDFITEKIERRYQKRWVRYKRKKIKYYEKKEEVDRVLVKYKEKMYLFITRKTEEERKTCNYITISLVRLAQKGNVCAKDELIKWVTYITDDWIDKYPQLYKWQGYPDEVVEKINGCIYRYKYTGSFLGYLFKTLEYLARGKPPICSLNDRIGDDGQTRVDFVIQDEDEYRMSF